MSFSINAFSDLCVSYPSWTELSAFLVSDEGGKLRVVQTEGSPYVIVRYTKSVSNFALAHVPLFRSVVWNTVTNRPVSIAPPKAEEGEPTEVAVRVSDFVDGTMIQAWQDGDQLQIATRTSLGAKGGFYSTRSFADMLNDALKGSGGTDKFLRSVLKSGQFISLVLQHKDHKTVAPIPYNRVFVCYFGSVDSDGAVTMTQDTSVWPERLASYAPQLYAAGAMSALGSAKSMLQENQNKGYSWQGLVFQDMASSRRWRLRNPAYVIVRTLRGPEANQAARFLRLRHSGNVKQYLSYFREESNMMWDFEKTLRQRSAELYGAYNDMNKLKTKTMRDLPYSLRPHVYALHGKYLAQLSAKNAETATVESISKSTVIDYVNALAVEDQLKLLEGDRVPLTRPLSLASHGQAQARA